MAFASIEGKQIYYEEAGSGHPLVLVHSALMNSTMWADQVPVFAQHFRTITLDLYGFGKSAFTDQKIMNHALDLKGLLDHLGIEKTHILGLSMGAEAVLSFALEYPERVSALVLVSSGLDGFDYSKYGPITWWENFIGAIHQKEFDKAIDVFMGAAVDGVDVPASPAVRERARAIMKTYNFRHYYDDELMWWGPDVPPIEQLDKIKFPLLVMIGAEDHPIHVDIADEYVKRVPGAKKVIVPGAAHVINFQQPEFFNKTVLDFLKQVK